MTNAEYFKEQIKKLVDNGCGIAVVKGKPVSCVDTNCEKCDLYLYGEDCGPISRHDIKWLISEHFEEKTIKASELADDTRVLASNIDNNFSCANRRHFAKKLDNKLLTYENGTTFWTSLGFVTCWKYMWLEDGTRVVEG